MAVANSSNRDASELKEQSQACATAGKQKKRSCYFCGGPWDHSRVNCPARNSKCNSCGIKGHYSRVCRKTKRRHYSESSGSESANAASALVASVTTKDPPSSLASATLPIIIRGQLTKALLDSGASLNFIDSSFVKDLGLKLTDCSEKIAMASTVLDQTLQGTLTIDINAGGRIYQNVKFGALPSLCSDVILGQDFMKLHSEVNFRTGGTEKPLNIPSCSLAVAKIDPPRLFKFLSPSCRPIAILSRRHNPEDKKERKSKTSLTQELSRRLVLLGERRF